MKVTSAAITERKEGWEVVFSDGRHALHTTAFDALMQIKERDKETAAAGITCMTIIDWQCNSRIGRAVVTMLTT